MPKSVIVFLVLFFNHAIGYATMFGHHAPREYKYIFLQKLN